MVKVGNALVARGAIRNMIPPSMQDNSHRLCGVIAIYLVMILIVAMLLLWGVMNWE
jgi:hypothetical protein